MDGYGVNTSPQMHHVPQTQSSLQGALSSGLSASDQEMQRHVEEYNRTITVVFWYKAETEPIRLQQMIPTFPYFHLSCLAPLVTDLGLTSKSFVDTYDPRRGKWEQHTIETVRVVEPQERVLYRSRRSLLDGLSEDECPGLREELHSQQFKYGRPQPLPPPPPPPTPSQQAQVDWQSSRGPLKRSPPTPEPAPAPAPPKVHITNGYYITHTATPNPTPTSLGTPVASTSALIPTPQDQSKPVLQPPFYTNPAAASTPTTTSPPSTTTPAAPATTPSPRNPAPSTPDGTPPIPYHPHPPLKRWPNDYTVAELTAGFRAMEALVAHAPAGAAVTQRAAFERVFGSRYVKSTVCRHRGVWRKAQGALREQFEALGSDERACWGEFIRRVEGRPPAKGLGGVPLGGPGMGLGMGMGPQQGVMMYPGHGGAVVAGRMVLMGGGAGGVESVQAPMMPPRTGEDGRSVEEEPIMASLQKPEGEDEGSGSVQSGGFQRDRV